MTFNCYFLLKMECRGKVHTDRPAGSAEEWAQGPAGVLVFVSAFLKTMHECHSYEYICIIYELTFKQ